MNSLTSGLLFIAISIAVLFHSTATAAQTAEEELTRGDVLFQDGEYKDAVEAYLNAYELNPQTETLYLIGVSYKYSGDLQLAEQYLESFLEEAEDPEKRESVIEEIIEIQMLETGDMTLLQVLSTPPGADVFFDQAPLAECKTPCERTMPIGDYVVEVKLEGFDNKIQDLAIAESGVVNLRFFLEPVVLKAHLKVTGITGYELRINQKKVGTLPIEKNISTPPGNYTVSLHDDNTLIWDGKIELSSNSNTQLILAENSSSGSFKEYLPWTLIGGGVLLGGVGMIFGISANSTYDSLETQKNSGQIPNQDLISTGETQAVAANVFYGLAGVALISGAVLLLWPHSESNSDINSDDEANLSSSFAFGVGPAGGAPGIAISISGDFL